MCVCVCIANSQTLQAPEINMDFPSDKYDNEDDDENDESGSDYDDYENDDTEASPRVARRPWKERLDGTDRSS